MFINGNGINGKISQKESLISETSTKTFLIIRVVNIRGETIRNELYVKTHWRPNM